MKEFPTPKESIVDLFKAMLWMFDGGAFPHVDALYQFVFTDIDQGLPLSIRFRNGSAVYQEGLSEKPTVVITTTSEVWLDIAGRIRNPVWALLTGKVKVKGDMAAFRMLPRLLTRTITVPAPKTVDRPTEGRQRVLVFVGNPRKKNGLTPLLLSPFVEGMKEAGAEVEEIQLYDKKINHCLGCFACWIKTPGVCVIKDDQKELLEKMDRADLIVYAVPLYYYSVPGLVKDHFDRQLPRVQPYFQEVNGLMSHPYRKKTGQKVVLFSISGFPELVHFNSLVAMFESYTRRDRSTLCATVLVPAAMHLYLNPTQRSVLLRKFELLRSAGEQVVRTGSVSTRTLKHLAKVKIGSDWIKGANLYWHHEIEENGKMKTAESS